MDQVKFFKVTLPQISLGTFLNTLPHIQFWYLAYSYIFLYNLGHNILRLFDVFAIFPFTTSETNRDY